MATNDSDYAKDNAEFLRNLESSQAVAPTFATSEEQFMAYEPKINIDIPSMNNAYIPPDIPIPTIANTAVPSTYMPSAITNGSQYTHYSTFIPLSNEPSTMRSQAESGYTISPSYAPSTSQPVNQISVNTASSTGSGSVSDRFQRPSDHDLNLHDKVPIGDDVASPTVSPHDITVQDTPNAPAPASVPAVENDASPAVPAPAVVQESFAMSAPPPPYPTNKGSTLPPTLNPNILPMQPFIAPPAVAYQAGSEAHPLAVLDTPSPSAPPDPGHEMVQNTIAIQEQQPAVVPPFVETDAQDATSHFEPRRHELVANEHVLAKESGIYCKDPLICADKEKIKGFLSEHNISPVIILKIMGTHKERRTRRVRDSNGNYRTETYYVTITDFNIRKRIVEHIQPRHNVVINNDNMYNPEAISIKPGENFSEGAELIIDAFLAETCKHKCLLLSKKTSIEINYIFGVVEPYIRNTTGYSGKISVTSYQEDDHVSCIITALCIVWLPLKWCWNTLSERKYKLASRYELRNDIFDQWFVAEQNDIREAVNSRRR